jgi:multimeric flavodoxin WrbA
MAKKVLVLSASPRKGENSDLLCDQFPRGAKERGVIYGTGAWKVGDIKGSRAMTKAYEMGEEYRLKRSESLTLKRHKGGAHGNE